MKEVTFYHAGCPVCLSAEQQLATALNPDAYQVKVIHLGNEPELIDEVESRGIKSVPALVIDKDVFHINFGASIEDLKGALS
jgi:glutaredoxin